VFFVSTRQIIYTGLQSVSQSVAGVQIVPSRLSVTAEHRGWGVNNPSYSGHLSRQIQGHYVKVGHDRFFAHPSNSSFTIILPFVAI